MEPIVLVGGGGHCISCIDVLHLTQQYEIVGILDVHENVGKFISGIEIIGTDDDISILADKYKNFLIAVGQIKTPDNRQRIYNKIKSSGGVLPVIISPRAYVSKTAIINEGTIIMHNALVNANVAIGNNCIINSSALIEHEVIIGDFCHISTQAVVNGQVKIGSRSFIGSNSVIVNNIYVIDSTIIGAGALINKDIWEAGIYVGNPVKKLTNI